VWVDGPRSKQVEILRSQTLILPRAVTRAHNLKRALVSRSGLINLAGNGSESLGSGQSGKAWVLAKVPGGG